MKLGSKDTKSFTQYDLIELGSETKDTSEDGVEVENYWKDKINLLKNSSLYAKDKGSLPKSEINSVVEPEVELWIRTLTKLIVVLFTEAFT